MDRFFTVPSSYKHLSDYFIQPFSLLGWFLFCFAAAAPSALIPIDAWYEELRKPSWNPPPWLFGPVWTLMYTLMSISAWLIWRQGGWKFQHRALGLFLVQWLLNLLWTPIFFGMKHIGLALVEMTLLWLAIAATLYVFWRVNQWAGFLLLPYLAWVTFAWALNFTLWKLNLP